MTQTGILRWRLSPRGLPPANPLFNDNHTYQSLREARQRDEAISVVGRERITITTINNWAMKTKKNYYVYIMTNKVNTILYTGVTNNLQRRVLEHKKGGNKGFTKKYKISKLVYYEIADSLDSAIFREKQIKGGSRKNKIALINRKKPEWNDLYDEFYS